MYFQKRGVRYTFLYYDSKLKKNFKLSVKKTPRIQTDLEAKAFCQMWDAKRDSMRARMQNRLEWQNKFHNFNQLLESYIKVRKEESPNNWWNNESDMKFYILPYFLDLLGENNLNNWAWHYEKFREHLQAVKPTRSLNGGKTLRFATMNRIIVTLNTFIKTMHRLKQVDRVEICRSFPTHLVGARTEENILSKQEQDEIYGQLKILAPASADFFFLCLHTGMRVSELRGISLADFYAGEMDDKVLKLAIKPYDLEIYGYISLESQPKFSTPRDVKGNVTRKPLKGKKTIAPDHTKIIPIFNKEAFNTLARLWNGQRELFQKKRYGDDLKNYLLFNNLTKNQHAHYLRQAQKALHYTKFYTSHDCRHTYCTWLVGETGGNFLLAKSVVGHSDMRTTLRYVHLIGKMHRNIRSKVQLQDSMNLLGELPSLPSGTKEPLPNSFLYNVNFKSKQVLRAYK